MKQETLSNLSIDERGELLRRFMAHKSLIDQMSSWWFEMRLWKKIISIVGFSLFAGAFALFSSATLPLSLTTLFFLLAAHYLFSSHEQNRRKGGEIFTEEAMELNNNLKASEGCLKKMVNSLQENNNKVRNHLRKVEEEVIFLDFQSRSCVLQQEELNSVMQSALKETTHLMEQEKTVKEKLKGISIGVKEREEQSLEIDQLKNDLIESAAISQFSNTVQGMQQSQKAFSHAVNHFCFFINENNSGQVTYGKHHHWLKKQVEEDEKYIANGELSSRLLTNPTDFVHCKLS